MKKIKKMLAMLLTLIMAMALAISAFAADTYTITIDNKTSGHTYEAYQVFKGDLSRDVLSNIEWGAGVNGDALLTALKADDTIGTSFEDCESAADVAEVLAKSFKDNPANLDAFAAVVGAHLADAATGTSIWDADQKQYTISGLAAGYYFVKNSSVPNTGAYTKFMLKLVKNTTVTPKSDVPSVEKKVQEDDKYKEDGGYGDGYNDVADWNIGDAVPFKLIGTIPEMEGYETYKYSFHDTLSNGLTLNADSIKVYVTEGKDATLNELTPLEKDTDYTVTTSDTGDGCSFEVSFSDLTTIDAVTAESAKYIIVAYTATLNENAVIGLPGNPNEVYLKFSNNPAQSGEDDNEEGETPEDKVIVFTYELDTTKVDGADPQEKLENAEFVLLNEAGDKVAKVNAGTGKFEGWVDLPTGTGTAGAITYEDWTTLNESDKVILKSGDQGLFKVIGLDDGTYNLREIKAPDGYNLLDDDVEVVITATTANSQSWTSGNASEALTNLTVTADSKSGTGDVNTGIAGVTIANNKGATLPETGGMGTTIFYILGGILVIGAGVLLITKKRMNVSEDK